MGMVVYALAQYSTLRRIRQEEEEAEAIVRNQLLANIPPPIFQTTPPTPQPQNGTNVAILSSGAANPNNRYGNMHFKKTYIHKISFWRLLIGGDSQLNQPIRSPPLPIPDRVFKTMIIIIIIIFLIL